MTVTKDMTGEETKNYELGLLLTPLLTEEAATALLNETFKTLFEKHEAVIVSTDAPKMIPLAYTIRKRIDNKNQVFREAHFASIRFTALPESIPALKEQVRKMSEVIRSLLIIVPKVTEVATEKREKVASEATVKEGKSEEVSTDAPAVVADQKEVIDREIDKLCI